MSTSEKLERPRKFNLLDPTASNIASTRELETRKNIVKDEDDIWWEKRGTRVYQKTFHYHHANENGEESTNQRRSKSASRVRESEDGQESLLHETLIDKQKYLRSSFTVSQISPTNRLLVSTTLANTRKQQVEELLNKSRNGSKSPSAATTIRNASDTLSVKSEGRSEKKPNWAANHDTLLDSSLTQVLPGSKHKFNVTSKLYQPTNATTSGTWKKPSDKSSPDKYHSGSNSVFSSNSASSTPHRKPSATSTTPGATTTPSENGVPGSVDEIPSPVDKETEKLLDEFTSRLTRPTKATTRGQWKKEEVVVPKSPARRKSVCSAEVTNRLTRPTTATINGKWTKEIETPDSAAGAGTVTGATPDDHPTAATPSASARPSSASKPPPDVSRLTRPTKATTRGAWKKADTESELEEGLSLSPTRQSQSGGASQSSSASRRTPDVDRLTRPTAATTRGIWHKPEVVEEVVEVDRPPAATTRYINPTSHLITPTTASIHQRLSKSTTTPERRRSIGTTLSLASSSHESSELADSIRNSNHSKGSSGSPSTSTSTSPSGRKMTTSPKSPSHLHRSPSSDRSQPSSSALGLSHDWNAEEDDPIVVSPPPLPATPTTTATATAVTSTD